MPTSSRRAYSYLTSLLETQSEDGLKARLAPKGGAPAFAFPRDTAISTDLLAERWRVLANEAAREQLLDAHAAATAEVYAHNIEHFIGTLKLPVGVAGPLRVNGLFAQGDYAVPLATTEAALVASYNRGAQVITAAGGCTAMLLSESVSRAPGFAFADLTEAGEFVRWVLTQQDAFKEVAARTTRYGRLEDLSLTLEGNHVYLKLDYSTGDAAGQNMVTIATQAVLDHTLKTSPVQPQYSFLEANLSGDKKASSQSFMSVRGKKVTAEVTLSAELVQKRLHTTPERMADYWRMSSVGGVLSGTIGVQGHYANGLAALYLACGQDAACVAESAVGVTRLELSEDGGLYAAVTLPNLIVGTVGGGTGLPSQKACLDLLGLAGEGKARAFAEVCAGLCLGGELSLVAALCAGHFTQAHERFARGT